jgi:hypothetical protein
LAKRKITKLPSHVNVGHNKISIRIVPNLASDEGKAQWGLYSPKHGTISIDADLVNHPPVFVEILLHEILHAVWMNHNAMNFQADANDKLWSEEQCVSLYGLALPGLFKLNPWLSKWIMKNA